MKPEKRFLGGVVVAIFTCLSSAVTAEQPDLRLQQLHQDILASTRSQDSIKGVAVVRLKRINANESQSLATRFKDVLSGEDFSASEDAHKRIKACSDIAQGLLPSAKDVASISPGQSSTLLDALEAYADKINRNIDKTWSFMPVVANVIPPAGVPNAISGMDPAAISDPEQRRNYESQIAAERAKQKRNDQQKELRRARDKFLFLSTGLLSSEGQPGWTAAELYKHFAKDDDSKAILTEHIKHTGHSQ